MRFGVMGPLTIEADQPIAIGGSQLRRLLAALLVDVGQVVSVDRLADIVFDGMPSDAAPTTLRSYVARLRRVVGDDGTGVSIVTVPPGYRLDLGASELDARLFEMAVDVARRDGRDGNSAAVAEGLGRAMALWRGPAYTEFAHEEWAHPEAIRLDEMRMEADEMRLTALVDDGRHEAALADLTRFVEAHPYRGQGWTSLMLALYRSGRQAEALRLVARHRRVMGEVGLEPTPELITLEERIATHDPAIRQPAPASRRLRGYHLVEEIGRGRHGVVHGSVQPGVDRDVALRQFGPDVADLSGFIRSFDGLVQQVARLEHPYVVPILDFWREPGLACLVTRRFRGGSLTALFDKGPAGAEVVAALVDQVSSSLHAAHRSGLAHGALSPGDILFDDDGNAFVDGIGIDAALDALLGLVPATTFAPPEPEPGDTADQYTLAALAYRALTGFPPLVSSAPGRAFPHVSDARPELLAIDGVLARAGARNPDDRYADVATFARSLSAAVGRTHQLVPAAQVPVTNPYRGLRAFGEADAPVFFGRHEVVARLLDALEQRRSPIITLIGSSGSGKSSVVRAGLLPRLRAGAIAGSADWYVTTMVPGPDPFAAFTDSLGSVATSSTAGADVEREGIAVAVRRLVPHGAELLLVMDQFEELFTIADERTRMRFVLQLTEALTDTATPIRVVATLRADYYDRPLAHHVLGQLVAAGAVPVVAMAPAEFEQAIVEPAASTGVDVDGRVVAEIVAACANRPGSLPLLQFCMTELFSRRTTRTVTFDDYRRLNGITGAIAERAETIFDSLNATDRQATRRVFLRLVTVGEPHDDVRRRVRRTELTALGERDGIDRVLEVFGEARLLTFDRDPATREQTVEVAHESLLKSWPRLSEWIRVEGQGLTIRSELTTAAHVWERGGRDGGDLYRGARLVVAEGFVDEHVDDLTALEREFVGRSVAARDLELAEERAQAAGQRVSNRRLRRSLVVTAVVLTVAVAGRRAGGRPARSRPIGDRRSGAVARTCAVRRCDRGTRRGPKPLVAPEPRG